MPTQPPRSSSPPVVDVNINARKQTEADKLRSRMNYYKDLIARRKSDIVNFQRQIRSLGKSPAQQKLRVQLEASIKRAQEDLNSFSAKFDDTQNKYYQATGEYEKLLKGGERDAFLALKTMFTSFGLGGLADKIFDFVKQGYSSDTISILLQDTKEYKERFVGNEARRKAGLPVLSPAEYLSTEAAYKRIMEAAGLPKGFYDSNKDFADFIGKNISPSEIQDRVNMAVQATTLANDSVKKALKQMGLSSGEIVAYFLDEKKATPILQRTFQTAQIGAQALARGLTFDENYAEALAKQGITAEQAAQGYTSIADELGTLTTLGSIYGERWTQRSSEKATFGGEGSAQAIAKRKRLASQERGNFSGAAGTARGGLAGRGGQR